MKSKKKKTKPKFRKTLKIYKPQLHTINNYKVVVIKNNSHLVSIHSYILNGFIHETKENLGINHLLEHTLVNSYKKCKKFNCYEYLNKLGLDFNATVTNNIINYYVNGLNRDTDKMLEYIINITLAPEFNNKVINREKYAVYNELLQHIDDSKYEIKNMMNRLFYTYYGLQNSNNARQQISNLEKFTAKYFREYYKNNYTHKNILFVVSGNFDKSKIIKQLKYLLVKKDLQDTEHNIIPISKILSNFKHCFKLQSITKFLKNEKLEGSQIYICFPTNLNYNSDQLIQLTLANDILKYYLYQLLRVEKKLIYSIEISTQVTICGISISIFINTKNENVLSILKLLKSTINHYKVDKISNRLIEPFKKKFLVKYHSANYTSKNLADIYGIQYIYQFFLNTQILYPDEIKNKYLKTTSRDIQKAIKQNYNFNKVTCVYSNSTRSVKYTL